MANESSHREHLHEVKALELGNSAQIKIDIRCHGTAADVQSCVDGYSAGFR